MGARRWWPVAVALAGVTASVLLAGWYHAHAMDWFTACDRSSPRGTCGAGLFGVLLFVPRTLLYLSRAVVLALVVLPAASALVLLGVVLARGRAAPQEEEHPSDVARLVDLFEQRDTPHP